MRTGDLPGVGRTWWRAALMLALLMLWLTPGAASAHGGGVARLVQVQAGPYELYAWTSPDPVRVGTMHVTVALAEPGSDDPVLGAAVEVRVIPVDTVEPAETLVAQATNSAAANRITYETDLEVPVEGQWQTVIHFDSPEGSGSAQFDVEVKARSLTNWLLIGGAGLAVLVVGWALWPGSEAKDAEAAKP